MTTEGPLVLGIETSCDETGVGIVRGEALLVDAVASSVDEHARFGGVVPEVASRAHLEAMVPTIERACRDSGVRLDDLDAVAVTAGPGLAGALLVGVAAAKALAVGLDKPLYGVNHLASHVAVDVVEHGPLPEPCVALLVSGGHSSLLLVPDVTADVRPLGSTIDDAAGEAFDKVARVLGLPFPGGPHIDRAAREGNRVAIDFPRGPHRGPRSRAAPVRLLVLRPEDRSGAVGPAARAVGRRGPGRGRGGQLPGGRGRRAHAQGGRRLPVRGRGRPPPRGRSGRELSAARARPGAVRRRRDRGCGYRGPASAPTTGPWWPRSAHRWWPAASPRRRWTCRRTRRCR